MVNGALWRIFNVLPWKNIEGPLRDFLNVNPWPDPLPDQRQKPLGSAAPRGFWPLVWPWMWH